MAKVMKQTSVIALVLTLAFCFLFRMTRNSVIFSFAITFATIAYHFTVRILIGGVVNLIMKNKTDYTKKWYQVSATEMKLYQKLKVKGWKNKMPTYDKDTFDTSKHSWDEIIQATCQSELVHEINVVISFVPIIASVWVGALWVFFITSVLSAMFDLLFVFIQRFNRARIRKIIEKEKLSGEKMREYQYITLREKTEIKDMAATWFQSKWGVPKEAYLECMDAYLNRETEYGWYLCLDGDKIVSGMGVIENDFHDRKDLSPNVCAVYTEEEYRGKGIAGILLNMVVKDMKEKGITPIYLVTDHTGFYERYDWEFLCMVQGDGEEEMTRMYIHK